MTHSLDVELFINEVKKYPEIWDLNSDDYKDKVRKQQAWAEIARIFINDFDDMSHTEKMEIYKTLYGKWRNIRDSYVRHVKRRYGKNGYKRAKYLTFLNNVYTQNSQSGSEADPEETWCSDTEDTKSQLNIKKPLDDKNDLIWTSDIEDDQPLIETRKRKRPKKDIEYVEAFPEAACSFNNEDEDRSFFESLLPAVRTLDIDHKLEFRSQVIKLVKNMRISAKKVKMETSDAFED